MKRIALCASLALAATALLVAEPVAYDPLIVPGKPINSKTFTVYDAKHDRTLPIRVYLPETEKPAPVILFSHGLGGSRNNNPYLGNHWAARGYVVVFLQHPGSDADVWKDKPLLERMAAVKGAATVANFLLRAQDIPAVIDALEIWNRENEHPLKGRLELAHLGMSGHSFGAITTQAVAGESFIEKNLPFLEPRIRAAVMMSPSPPELGNPVTAFAPIKIPCLLMTGTADVSPIGITPTAADRLKVFPSLTSAPAWQVVLDHAEHMTFNEVDLFHQPIKDARYHRAILALTTAFWDMQLKSDPAAKKWLNSDSARSVLVPADKWEMNGKAQE